MSVRNTQQPAEILEAPTSTQARNTQQPAEILEAPTTAKARATQLCVEILLGAKKGFPMMLPGVWPGPWASGGGRRVRP